MEITFACPGCGKGYRKSLSLVGKRAVCKQCSREFIIPAPQDVSASGTVDEPVNDTYSLSKEPLAPSNPARRAPGDQAINAESRSNSSQSRPHQPTTNGLRGAVVPSLIGGAGVAIVFTIGLGLMSMFGGNKQVVEAVPPVVAIVAARAEPIPLTEPAIPVSTAKPISAAVNAATPLSVADLVARCEPSVALIKGKRGSGTGFLVRPGILATNAHVIEGETIENIEVRFPSADGPNQGPIGARMLYQDKLRDLAFLAVVTDLPPLTVAGASTFRKGEDVMVIGNPGVGGKIVLENAMSRGVIGSKTKLNGRDLLQLGISINPGNSGGPVLDTSGNVIGVVTLRASRQEGLAFCVLAEDLNVALAVAESRVGMVAGAGTPFEPSRPISTPVTVAAKGNIPELNYGWVSGQTYVYAVDISIDAGQVIIVMQGTSIYRVKSVDDDVIALGHRGSLVTRRRGKDGRVINGGVSGPTGGDREVELRIDRKGNVLDAVGASPLPLLGDLSMLVIDPLPEGAQTAWEEAQSISLTEVQQVAGAGGGSLRLGRPDVGSMPRGLQSRAGSRLAGSARSRLGARLQQQRPAPAAPTTKVQVTAHPAQEQTNYSLGLTAGDTIQITKKYELTTQEIVSDEPRLKMTGDGTVVFDLKAGMPIKVDFRAKVVENTSNSTVRVPIVVSCRLLSGQERAKALRAQVMPPTSLNPIDEGELSRVLVDLKSSDSNRVRGAAQILYEAAPVETRRSEVARGLEKVLTNRDASLRADTVKALGVWGDDRSTNPLVVRVADESFGARDQLFEAIGRLEPSAAVAEAVIPWLDKDSNHASRTLRAIGPASEQPLLQVLGKDVEPRIKSEVCRVLKDVGGAESVPVLEGLARLKDNVEVGRIAGESLKAIARRNPADGEWKSILLDTNSPDGGRRRQAADRLIAIEPIPARRAEVARALESLAADVDGGTQTLAFRALAKWGDDDSRRFLHGRLTDPKLQISRELIDAVIRLGPLDTRVAEVVAQRFKADRRLVGEALTTIGAAAEKSVITLLDGERDWGVRNDLCKLLTNIGTEASRLVLGEVARSDDNGIVKGSAQRALQEIQARSGEDHGVGAILADLKSSDQNRCKQAVERLALTQPGGVPRADIARAIDTLLGDQDTSMHQILIRAAGTWGDDQTADMLLAQLERKDLRDWRETLQALFQLRPDDRSVAAAVRRLPEDTRLIISFLRPLGSSVERALIAAMRSGSDTRTRVEACRALGELGSSEASSYLKELAGKTREEQVARDAEDALKAINARL